MVADIFQNLMDSVFFTYALPWLLTFAIAYGLLEHIGVPKDKSARGVISIVLAFLILPVAGPIMAFLSQLGAGLILVFMGLIFFLILIELTGTKITKKEEIGRDEKGQPVVKEPGKKEKIQEKHTKLFGGIILILGLAVFVGAGGFDMLGFTVPQINYTTIFFLAIVALAIWWMVKEGK